MSADERYARYFTKVHAINRNSDYGIPVEVIATNRHEAHRRAVAIGWSGYPEHARVTVLRVEDLPPTTEESA